jgi:Tol biopolymer transport system component
VPTAASSRCSSVDVTSAPYVARQLTRTSEGAFNNTQPAWSPDGSTILVRTNRADPR